MKGSVRETILSVYKQISFHLMHSEISMNIVIWGGILTFEDLDNQGCTVYTSNQQTHGGERLVMDYGEDVAACAVVCKT